jgi:diphthamide biosynthesis enzyme Dph1/Dph2-like protein
MFWETAPTEAVVQTFCRLCIFLPTYWFTTDTLVLPGEAYLSRFSCCLSLTKTFLLYRTEALPVLYVFPKRDLDCNNVAEQLYQVAFDSEESAENVVVMWDVAYDWIKGDSLSLEIV